MARTEPQEKPGAGETADWGEYVCGQIARAFLPGGLSTEQASHLCALIATGMAGIEPKGALEEMIAAQMLACHDAAMDLLRYAVNSSESSSLRREHLNQAGKLSRTFAMLLDALNRHRGKGMQKITVEHVHVHSGGQAVVGVVEAPGGGVNAKSENQGHGKRQPSFRIEHLRSSKNR